jgi:hypothetical protein
VSLDPGPVLEAMNPRAPEPFSIARVISDSVRTLRHHGLTLAAIAVPLMAIPEGLAGWTLLQLNADVLRYNLVSIALALTVNVLAGLAMLHLTMTALSGERTSLRDSLTQAVRLLPAGVGLSLLIGMGTFIGLIFLVIPGLIVIVTCYVAFAYRIDHGPGVMDAIKSSTELSEGSRWPILGVVLLTWLAAAVLIGGLWLVERSLTPALGDAGYEVMNFVVSPLGHALQAIIAAVVPGAVYHELVHRGRAGLARTAEIFD